MAKGGGRERKNKNKKLVNEGHEICTEERLPLDTVISER